MFEVIYIFISAFVTYQFDNPIFGVFLSNIVYILTFSKNYGFALPTSFAFAGALLIKITKGKDERKEIFTLFVCCYLLQSLILPDNELYKITLVLLQAWTFFGIDWYMNRKEEEEKRKK